MEQWKKIDFIKLFSFPFEPKRSYFVSDQGDIKVLSSGGRGTFLCGCVRKAFKDHPALRYLNIRLGERSYHLSLVSIVIGVFVDPDFSRYNYSFKNQDPLDCSVQNIKLDLKKRLGAVSDDVLAMYSTYAGNGNLYKMMEYLLVKTSPGFSDLYSKEDFLQDFVVYLYDLLFEFSSGRFKSFDSFVFFKGYDFIGKVKKRLSLSPLVVSLDVDNDDVDDWTLAMATHERLSSEKGAVGISDFTFRCSHSLDIWAN